MNKRGVEDLVDVFELCYDLNDVSVLCSEERGEQWKAANFLVDVHLYSCLRSLGESSSVL